MDALRKTIPLCLLLLIAVLLPTGCATEDDEINELNSIAIYGKNDNPIANVQSLGTYDGYWQYQGERQEKAVLELSNAYARVSCPPCSTIVKRIVPAEHREAALASIENSPLTLLLQYFAGNNDSHYFLNITPSFSFKVSYGGEVHVVSVELDSKSQCYFDQLHQLAYALLYPTSVSIDDKPADGTLFTEALMFNPVARRK